MEATCTIEYDSPPMVRGDDDDGGNLLNIEAMKSRRLALDLSQQEAADRAGFKDGNRQWNSIESGRRASITLSTLAKIAKALELRPADLLLDAPGGESPTETPEEVKPKPSPAKPKAVKPKPRRSK